MHGRHVDNLPGSMEDVIPTRGLLLADNALAAILETLAHSPTLSCCPAMLPTTQEAAMVCTAATSGALRVLAAAGRPGYL